MKCIINYSNGNGTTESALCSSKKDAKRAKIYFENAGFKRVEIENNPSKENIKTLTEKGLIF